MTARQDYAQRLNALAARYGRQEDQVARRAVAMLRDVQRQIAAELAMVSDFNAARLRQLSANLERLVAEYQAQLGAEVRAAFETAFDAGGRSAVEPLQAIGIEGAFYQPSRAQVQTVLDFSADLVQEIADQVRAQINTQVRLAALGQRDPLAAVKAIGDALGAGKGRQVVTGVAARAETDLRTEMQRVFNLSNHAQQQVTARQVPELRKRWIAAGDGRTRLSHLRLHHETRDNPIPVDELFIMRDERGTARLMYPLDPAAPPWAVINCRCRMATIHPQVGVIGSSLDGRIAAELERRAA